MKALRTAVAIVGAIATVASFIPGPHQALAATVAKVAAVASTALAIVAKPPHPSQVGSLTDYRLDPQAGLPYAMGRTFYAGNGIKRETWGKDNAFQGFTTVYSVGPIEAIESFSIDRVVRTFDASYNETGSLRDYHWFVSQLGACPEPASLPVPTFPSQGAPGYPGWGAADKLSGLAASFWVVRFDTKGKKFMGGVPTPGVVMKGVKVYDPRLDSTYPGGSGSCRALQENTYVYSERPALHGLTYALGRWQNGKKRFGIGFPVSSIDIASFVSAANVEDANDWKVGGLINSLDNKWNSLKKIGQAGAWEPIRLGGRLSIVQSAPRVSIATIQSSDVVGEGSIVATQSRRERLNGMVPRYRSEAHGWQIIPADVVRVSAYVTADGGLRTSEHDLELVQVLKQATQLTAYEIVNRREIGPIDLRLKLRWIGAKPGDCLTLNVPEMNLNNQKAILISRSLDPSTGAVNCQFKSETDSKHAFALGQVGAAPPVPVLTAADPAVVPAPVATDWAMTAVQLASAGFGSVPALRFQGIVAETNAEAVLFDYRKSGTTEWIGQQTAPPTTTVFDITSLEPAAAYEGGIRYVVRGVIGDRLIKGPVTLTGLQATPPEWSDVKDGSGLKPEDDATKGAPAGTYVAGVLAESLIAQVAASSDTVAPGATTGLALASVLSTDVDGSQRIKLIATWTANPAADTSRYDIDIKEGAGNYVTFLAAGTTFEWNVLANTLYTVRLRAVDTSGNQGPYSSAVTHTTLKDTGAPGIPTSFSATAAFSSIFLRWTNQSDADLDKIEVYEHTANASGSAVLIATLNATAGSQGSYTRSGLTTGQLRYYWLKAVDSSGNRSAFSTVASATTALVPTVDLSGQITGPQIALNAVTARHMVISDTTNLLLNGDFKTGNLDGWCRAAYLSASGDLIQVANGATVPSWPTPYDLQMCRGTAGTTHEISIQNGNYPMDTDVNGLGGFPSAIGDEYYFECFIWDDTKGGIGYVEALVMDAGTLRRIDGVYFTPNGLVTKRGWSFVNNLADGPLYIRLTHTGTTTAANAFLQWWSINLRKKNGGNLIVDGAITSAKIFAGSVTTGHMTAGTINADRLQAATLTGDRFLTSTSLPGTITVGSTGVQIGTIQAQAADPAARVNAMSTLINPGSILISGGTTLSSWRDPGDTTKILGGAISANTITANQVVIGLRGVQVIDLVFDTNRVDTVTWTGGYIEWTHNDGSRAVAFVNGGSAVYSNTGTSIVYIWFDKAASPANQVLYAAITSKDVVESNTNNIILASYRGSTNLTTNFGRTIIDGDVVKAGTVHGNRMVAGTMDANIIIANTITATQLATSQLLTTSAQIGDGLIINAKIGNLQVDTLKINGEAVTTAKIAQYAMGSVASFYFYYGDTSLSTTNGAWLYVSNGFTTAQVSLTTDANAGQEVIIDAIYNLRRTGGDDDNLNFRVIRSDGYVLPQTWTNLEITGNRAAFAFAFRDTTPAPNTTYTYSLQFMQNSGNPLFSNVWMKAELRKRG